MTDEEASGRARGIASPRRHGLGRGLDALLASSDPGRDMGVDPSSSSSTRSGSAPTRSSRDATSTPSRSRPWLRRSGCTGSSTRSSSSPTSTAIAWWRASAACERRVRLEFSLIPAILRPASESGRQALEMALSENLLREDLNPLEEAAAYARLADAFGLSHEAIALRLGRSRPAVTNAIRLLQLPVPLQKAVAARALSPGHARALLSLRDEAEMLRLGQRVAAEELTVRATERLVQERAAAAPASETGVARADAAAGRLSRTTSNCAVAWSRRSASRWSSSAAVVAAGWSLTSTTTRT